MGKLAVQKYFSFSILILTVLVMIFTLVGLYGGDVQPAGNTARAMLVYALPLLIAANVVLFLYWVIMRRFHWAFIPLIAIMCCIPYSGTIYQFGSLDEHADIKPGIKIATYNVAMFGRETSGFIAQDILSEMKKQKVDVACFQEYNDQSGDKKNSDSYKEYFPYMAQGEHDMVIYSRYPIVKSKNMNFEMTNNSAMWAEVNYKGTVIEGNALMRAFYGNYTLGMIARSGQANVLAMDMRDCERPIIVCGDFNDVPYSYVYNTMLGDKVDGFKECGSGFMYTFRGGNKKVRIDYIFHDKTFLGLSYYKRELSYSDHNPVFSKIQIPQDQQK